MLLLTPLEVNHHYLERCNAVSCFSDSKCFIGHLASLCMIIAVAKKKQVKSQVRCSTASIKLEFYV